MPRKETSTWSFPDLSLLVMPWMVGMGCVTVDLLSSQRNGRSLFLPCGKKPKCPEKRISASLLRTDNPKQAALG